MRFIGSIVAFKNSKFTHCTVLVEATSLEEAIGMTLRVATETHYPTIEGYYNHSITCAELNIAETELTKMLK